MKTKKQIKRRFEISKQLAAEFYEDWLETGKDVSWRLYRLFEKEFLVLKWVLED